VKVRRTDGDRQDRHTSGSGYLPYRMTNGKTVHMGHHHIEQENVRTLFSKQLHALFTASGIYDEHIAAL